MFQKKGKLTKFAILEIKDEHPKTENSGMMR